MFTKAISLSSLYGRSAIVILKKKKTFQGLYLVPEKIFFKYTIAFLP